MPRTSPQDEPTLVRQTHRDLIRQQHSTALRQLISRNTERRERARRDGEAAAANLDRRGDGSIGGTASFQRNPDTMQPRLRDVFQRHRPVVDDDGTPNALRCNACNAPWPCDAIELVEEVIQERCRALHHHRRLAHYTSNERGDAFLAHRSPEEQGQLRLTALVELGLLETDPHTRELVPATTTLYQLPEVRAEVTNSLREVGWQAGFVENHPTERRCSNCGNPPNRHGLRQGRCPACNMHWRRHGVERPCERRRMLDGRTRHPAAAPAPGHDESRVRAFGGRNGQGAGVVAPALRNG